MPPLPNFTPMNPSSPSARPAVKALRSSKIREVANAGMGKENVIAFWFGEPDEVTPAFIRRAGIEALERGETFYTQNLGIPELRGALASYTSRLHRPAGAAPISMDNIAITSSGMSALMLTTQALVGAGDRVVIVTPVWPNLVEIPRILGAEAVSFPLTYAPSGWTLDLERLLDTLTPGTRLVCINSPNNPTGWTISRDEQRAILDHCRRHGITGSTTSMTRPRARHNRRRSVPTSGPRGWLACRSSSTPAMQTRTSRLCCKTSGILGVPSCSFCTASAQRAPWPMRRWRWEAT